MREARIGLSISLRKLLEHSEADGSPTGVTRFNWTTNFPHYRPLHFAATTPNLHRIISDTADPLSLLIVPSRSTTTVRLAHSQELTIKHGTPAILCTSTLSAVIDPAGRILFQQSGGQTWSLGLALWYKEGEDRQRTGYENGYDGWLLGTVVTILSIRATISFIDKINKAETETGAGSATDVNVSGRDMCSSLNPIPSRTLPWSSRK